MMKEFENIGGESGVKEGNKFPALGCPDSVYEGLVLKCMAFEQMHRPLFHGVPGRTAVEDLIEVALPSTRS